MSKTPQSEQQTTVVAETSDLSLVEFCTRLSATVRRPELISAFEFSERRAGRVKDTAEAFQARFENFGKTPV